MKSSIQNPRRDDLPDDYFADEMNEPRVPENEPPELKELIDFPASGYRFELEF